MRFAVYTASAAVKSEPSCQYTPCFKLIVIIRPSGDIVYDCASTPSVLYDGSIPKSGSNTKPHRSLNADVTPGSFVKHKNFGVGVVQKVNGPKIDRILTIKFLSGVGKMELSIFDPDLELISFRPIQK